MKKTITTLTLIPVLLVLLVTGCTLDAPDSPLGLEAPEGTEIFANYVSIGNSLTAGFMDGGLIVNGQMGSYPRLIAMQMGLDASIGNSEFTQPYIAFPGVGSSTPSDPANAAGVLYFDGGGVAIVGETAQTAVPGLLMLSSLPTPYHNLGVPGATLHDVLNAYDAYSSTPIGNSFFNFINRESLFGNVEAPATSASPAFQSASMFGQTIAKGPSLVTVWIGNNDVLGAAMNADIATKPPTNGATFQAEYQAMLGTLAGGLLQRTGFPATIVTANIPSITSIPYFIPIATFEAIVGGPWNGGYEEANVAYVTFPTLSWAVPANADNAVPAGGTSSVGTLSVDEAAIIQDSVDFYNGVIATVTAGVNASGLATCDMVDMNAVMASLAADYGATAGTHFVLLVQQGMSVEAAAQATMFSLDGIHPNNRGYGIAANAFLSKIEELTGVDLDPVDLGTLSWDPTYGQTLETSSSGMPRLDPDAAEVMGAIFR
jgi:GDSL-like Lipase/Acylhydrolase